MLFTRWVDRLYFDVRAGASDPAGVIDSAEAQMKLNLNELVCTDMNVC